MQATQATPAIPRSDRGVLIEQQRNINTTTDYNDDIENTSPGHCLHTNVEEGSIASFSLTQPFSSLLSTMFTPQKRGNYPPPLNSPSRARLIKGLFADGIWHCECSLNHIHSLSNNQQATAIHDCPLPSSKSRKKDQTQGDGSIHVRSRRRMAAASSFGKKMRLQGRWAQL